MNTEKTTTVYKFIKDGLINIVIVGISLAYIFYNMIALEPTSDAVWELSIKGILSIICGILVKQGVGENGFSLGYNSSIWQDELIKYNNCCSLADKYADREDNFYYSREIEKRKAIRRDILRAVRLRYEDFFDVNGDYTDPILVSNSEYKKARKNGVSVIGRHLDKKQKKAIQKCLKLKVYTLNLFSEFREVSLMKSAPEMTDTDQRKKMALKNSFAQIFTGVVGVYFVPVFNNNWNWAAFIVATLQVAVWVATGIIQLYANYNYIVVDKVNKLKEKKSLIKMFITNCEKGYYITNPYDIDKKLEIKGEGNESSSFGVIGYENGTKQEEPESEVLG